MLGAQSVCYSSPRQWVVFAPYILQTTKKILFKKIDKSHNEQYEYSFVSGAICSMSGFLYECLMSHDTTNFNTNTSTCGGARAIHKFIQEVLEKRSACVKSFERQNIIGGVVNNPHEYPSVCDTLVDVWQHHVRGKCFYALYVYMKLWLYEHPI